MTKGGFGMNIVQLGQGENPAVAPQWWVAVAVSLGGTMICWPVIWGGVKLWRKYYREPKQTRRWLEKMWLNSV